MLLTSGRCKRNVHSTGCGTGITRHIHVMSVTHNIYYIYKQTLIYEYVCVECVRITCCCKLLSFRTFSKAFQRQTYKHIDRLILVCVLYTHTHAHMCMCSFTHLCGVSNSCTYHICCKCRRNTKLHPKLAGNTYT